MAGLLIVVCVPTGYHESLSTESTRKLNRLLDQVETPQAHRKEHRPAPQDDHKVDVEPKSTTDSKAITIKVNNREIVNGTPKMARSVSCDSPSASKRQQAETEDPLHPKPMEEVLEEVLKKLKVKNAAWCASLSGEFYQVFFSVGSAERCEEIITELNAVGIGIKHNSVVSVIPCTLYYQGDQNLVDKEPLNAEVLVESEKTGAKATKETAWEKFLTSVRARLTVMQVVEGVKSNATLTFDFLLLLLMAGLVAAMGLVENSSVALVASMLISPLMGPIMAGTFGVVIADRSLQKLGILNELFGLLMCLLVGFCFGIIVALLTDHWGSAWWPTEEMVARGQVRSLWVGVLIALPSGAAVALAILGDNTASLVGVAISASLLPPAVNAGLLWALACINILWAEHVQMDNDDNATTYTYTPIYSGTPAVELAILGAVSLCLTLLNIACIFVTGIVVLRVKEVAPRTSKDEQQFWKHDVKIARDYNRTFHAGDAEELRKKLAEKYGEDIHPTITALSPDILQAYRKMSCVSAISGQHTFQRSLDGHNRGSQFTWSPNTRGLFAEPKPIYQELDNIYNIFKRNQVAEPAQSKVRRTSFPGTSWFAGSNLSPSVSPFVLSPQLPHSGLSTIAESHATLSSPDTESRTSSSDGRRRFVVTPAKDV